MGLQYEGGRFCKKHKLKPWKFGTLDGIGRPIRPKIPSKQATISIRPIPLPSTEGSMMDELLSFGADNGNDICSSAMSVPTAVLNIKARPWFTPETVPDINEMLEDPTKVDKICAICGEDDLSAMDAMEHWEVDHGLQFDANLDEWNAALKRYLESGDERDHLPVFTNYYPSQEESPATPAGEGHMHRQGDLSITQVSEAVATAFQENILPVKQEIEERFNLLTQELATTSSAYSTKLSQVIRNNSEVGTAITRVAACQVEYSVKFDIMDSTLAKMNQGLETS